MKQSIAWNGTIFFMNRDHTHKTKRKKEKKNHKTNEITKTKLNKIYPLT